MAEVTLKPKFSEFNLTIDEFVYENLWFFICTNKNLNFTLFFVSTNYLTNFL